jgi:hypothetical protein
MRPPQAVVIVNFCLIEVRKGAPYLKKELGGNLRSTVAASMSLAWPRRHASLGNPVLFTKAANPEALPRACSRGRRQSMEMAGTPPSRTVPQNVTNMENNGVCIPQTAHFGPSHHPCKVPLQELQAAWEPCGAKIFVRFTNFIQAQWQTFFVLYIINTSRSPSFPVDALPGGREIAFVLARRRIF